MTTNCKKCKYYLCVNCVEDVAICRHPEIDGEYIEDANALCPLFEQNPILEVKK